MNKCFDHILKSERAANLVFLFTFLGMCLLYNYQDELFTRPHGYHIWRQADGFCVVNNYYRVSMNFFQPRISQFISKDGLELAEFPIVYYISALGYEIFGFHEFIPRLVSLIFLLFGLWSLYRLLADILSYRFYAIILSLLLFTSPVLIFYGITPLPDIAGMSLALAGLYHLYIYLRYGRIGRLILSFVFYAIGGCIKPTSVISLISVVSVLALVSILNFFKPGTFFKLKKRLVIKIGLFAVFTFGVIAGWWLYVGYYRNLHHTSYFQTNSNPIWGTKDGEILRTVKHFWIWMNHYFNFPSIIVAGALLIFALKIFYKKDKLVFLFYIILMLGCAGYMLLFFPNFYFHDYYIIVVLPLFIAALFLFVIAVRDTYPDVFFTDRFSTVVLLFFLLNVGYAAYKTHQRNTDLNFTKDNHVQLAHIEPYLDSIGIRQNDFVIYWGDFAPNIAFYLMNRRGWGQWALGCTLSQQNIDSCTSMGAKFLIIDRNQCILDDAKRNLINRYGSHKISDRDSIQIYSLR